MKPKVWTVEDSQEMQKTLKSIFTRLGCDVTGFWSAEEALAKLREGKHPDLFILDFKLPGMSGPQLFRRMGMDAKLKSIPVVPFTSHAEEAGVAAEWSRLADGSARVVKKDANELSVPEQLILTVANQLKMSPAGLPAAYEKAVLELIDRVLTLEGDAR